MPITADPADVLDYVLTIDRTKPKEEQPAFELRFLTMGEFRRMKKFIDRALADRQSEEVPALLDEAIKIGVARSRNLTVRGKAVDVAKDGASEYLSPTETWELVLALLNEPTVTEDDRKKSAYAQASGPAPSAQSATVPGAETTKEPS